MENLYLALMLGTFVVAKRCVSGACDALRADLSLDTAVRAKASDDT